MLALQRRRDFSEAVEPQSGISKLEVNKLITILVLLVRTHNTSPFISLPRVPVALSEELAIGTE